MSSIYKSEILKNIKDLSEIFPSNFLAKNFTQEIEKFCDSISNLSSIHPNMEKKIEMFDHQFMRPYFSNNEQQKIKEIVYQSYIHLSKLFPSTFMFRNNKKAYFAQFFSFFFCIPDELLNSKSSMNFFYLNQLILFLGKKSYSKYKNNSSSIKKYHVNNSYRYFVSPEEEEIIIKILNEIYKKDKINSLNPFINFNHLTYLGVNIFSPKINPDLFNYLLTNTAIHGKSYSNRNEYPFILSFFNHINTIKKHLINDNDFEENFLKQIDLFLTHPSINYFFTNELKKLSQNPDSKHSKNINQYLLRPYLQNPTIRSYLRNYFYTNHPHYYKTLFKRAKNDINMAKFFWIDNNNDISSILKYPNDIKLSSGKPNFLLAFFAYNSNDNISNIIENNPSIATFIMNANNRLYKPEKINPKSFLKVSPLIENYKKLFNPKLFNLFEDQFNLNTGITIEKLIQISSIHREQLLLNQIQKNESYLSNEKREQRIRKKL